MAKVLKVVISVVAPEKSIVPWAWATLVERKRKKGGGHRADGREKCWILEGCVVVDRRTV